MPVSGRRLAWTALVFAGALDVGGHTTALTNGGRVAVGPSPGESQTQPDLAIGNRVHTFAPPSARPAMIEFFTTVLGAKVLTLSTSPDVVAFAFADGSSLSVEFTPDALTPERARRGTWIELPTDDVEGMQARVLAAGVPRLPFPGSSLFYFQAPGGQVMRLVPRQRRKD